MKELNNLPYARNIFGIDDLALGTLGAGLVSGIGSLIGGKSASDANLQAQRETNKMQLDMFHQQMDYNLAAERRARSYALQDFQMENEYNSPAAQRARYEAAGLNPALMMQGGTPSAQIESTSAAVAPSAPQLGAPVRSDYITPAMQQLVNGMIGFSQAQKNAEEAAGIASDTRVKAATEKLRIQQAIQENKKRVLEIRSLKLDPKIKAMELKNLYEQNLILQDTNAMLDLTFDARSKAQETSNYVQDRLAAKYNQETIQQEIKNQFVYDHELNKLKLDEKQIENLIQSIVESKSRANLNDAMAIYTGLQSIGINPDTEQGKVYYKILKNNLEFSDIDLGSARFDYKNLDTPIGRFYRRIGLGIRSIIPVNVGIGLNSKK